MIPWLILLDTEDITHRVSSVTLNLEADNVCGECTVELADRRDLGLLTSVLPSKEPVIEILILDDYNGEYTGHSSYYLENIAYPENMDARTATLWGRSSEAYMAAPFAGTISWQWDGEHIDPVLETVLGESFPFNPLGTIPPGAYMAQNKTPAEILRDLADLWGYRLWPKWGYIETADANFLYPYGDVLDPETYIVNTITHSMPDFANRVLMFASASPQTRTVEVRVLGDADVPADGVSTVVLLAVVRDEMGVVLDGVEIYWSSSDGSLLHMITVSGGIDTAPYVESVRASSFDTVQLSYPASSVLGVYASASLVPGQGSEDPGPDNLMVALGGTVDNNTIRFSTDLPYYDMQLWVRYVPIGAGNVYTASTRQGTVTIIASVDGGSGSCLIRQGTGGKDLTVLVPDSVCYGAGPVSVSALGQVSGSAASGTVEFSMSGCGQISATTASFGAGSVVESLTVAGVDRDRERYITLSAIPTSPPVCTDEADEAVSYTQDPANPQLLWVNAPLRSTVTAAYGADGVATITWTPPPAQDTGDPGGGNGGDGGNGGTVTKKVKKEEWATVYWESVGQYWTGSQYTTKAAFIDISHEPVNEIMSPAPVMAFCPAIGVADGSWNHGSTLYQSHQGTKVRLRIVKDGSDWYRIIPAGYEVHAYYTYEETVDVPDPDPGDPTPPTPPRQPGCSGEITATFQDGSQAGVSATGRISVRDCTAE